MGCFLACFGISKKRKRPKSGNIVASPDQIHGSYVPLESDVFTELDNTQKHNTLGDELRDKPKETLCLKVKKKVSFNLNVKTYEPLQYDEIDAYFSEGEEKTKWEFDEEDIQRETMLGKHHEANAVAKSVAYPANYRYQNCSYDEEDEITIEDSDLDGDDFDDEEEVDDYDSTDEDENLNMKQVKLPMVNSASVESGKTVTNVQLAEETTKSYQELNETESNHNVRQRNQYAYSVLNPVENLTQWKAIKATTKRPKECRNIMLEQENQLPSHTKLSSDHVPLNSKPDLSHSKPLVCETAVNVSLSNWISKKTQNA